MHGSAEQLPLIIILLLDQFNNLASVILHLLSVIDNFVSVLEKFVNIVCLPFASQNPEILVWKVKFGLPEWKVSGENGIS